MEKIKTLLEIKKALTELKTSWGYCLEAFEKCDEVNDYIVDKYPFDKSFDEINANDWIDLSLENINKELKGLQK